VAGNQPDGFGGSNGAAFAGLPIQTGNVTFTAANRTNSNDAYEIGAASNATAAPGTYGGFGGGNIFFNVSSFSLSGSLIAYGADGTLSSNGSTPGGGGAGGSIDIIASTVSFAMKATLDVHGGVGVNGGGGGAGGRVDIVVGGITNVAEIDALRDTVTLALDGGVNNASNELQNGGVGTAVFFGQDVAKLFVSSRVWCRVHFVGA
jgi:hypothetical protein